MNPSIDAARNSRTEAKPSRSPAFYALLFLLVFQGISGVAGGIGLVGDPTGASAGLPLDWLAGSPFANYLIPGLVLLAVLGVIPLIVPADLWTHARWGRLSALAVGVMLLAWLGVEIAVVGFVSRPPFQAIYLCIGAATSR